MVVIRISRKRIGTIDPKSDASRLLTTQTATLNRIGSQDLVTQQTFWQAWSTAQLAAVSAPTITGYTPVTMVPVLTVNGQTADQTITIHYQATADSGETDQSGDDDNNNHTDQPSVDNPDLSSNPTDNPDQSEQGNGKPVDHENTDNSNSANSGDPAGEQNKPSTDNQSGDSDEQPTPATQTLMIQYWDEADQVIQTLSIQGTIGQALSLPQTSPSGWQLAPTATLPLTVTLQADQPGCSNRPPPSSCRQGPLTTWRYASGPPKSGHPNHQVPNTSRSSTNHAKRHADPDWGS